ncbi:hypothetical protein ACFQ14_14505 [Pseudahrensia aquimaris]|uniref:Uncharacterized protein n=1 Tax=Pseudahrensia aquimaris TaxID=744461 RepID=A0ABW3FI38_9HYPH
MYQVPHGQIDDIEDAIDMADLVSAAAVLYPPLASSSGVSLCADDVLAEIACNRHPNETIARFRDDPLGFLTKGEMIDIGPISAASFAVLVSALEAVGSAGHALDQLTGVKD